MKRLIILVAALAACNLPPSYNKTRDQIEKALGPTALCTRVRDEDGKEAGTPIRGEARCSAHGAELVCRFRWTHNADAWAMTQTCAPVGPYQTGAEATP